jgi:hypothetical protein
MRRLAWLPFVVLGIGCGPGAATNLLCTYCNDDSQCRGNPCFQDVSGGRFCGAPCDSCPPGYQCLPVTGTSGHVASTCFPKSEVCMPPGIVPPDAGVGQPPPTVPIPVGGPVGVQGGTVDRLFFGFTGDTRPDQCDGSYPQQVINNIYTQMKGAGVQFAVDQGDHMFNCQGGYPGAMQQMKAYLQAASLLGKSVFFTMGNHECTGESMTLCTLASYGHNANYTAYMDAMKQIGIQSPYYRFDVMTGTGLAAFIVVADDVWDPMEQSWLEQQLSDADARAKYTFVSKHHPEGNTDHPEFTTIYNLVRQHKYTLFLTGHTHEFKRQSSDPRAMVIGCGGAPLAGGSFWGYGTALQGPDDRITVTIYDQSSGHVMDSFAVAPQ